jgi:hypothetical protein
MNLARNRDQWWATVNMVVNSRVPFYGSVSCLYQDSRRLNSVIAKGADSS